MRRRYSRIARAIVLFASISGCTRAVSIFPDEHGSDRARVVGAHLVSPATGEPCTSAEISAFSRLHGGRRRGLFGMSDIYYADPGSYDFFIWCNGQTSETTGECLYNFCPHGPPALAVEIAAGGTYAIYCSPSGDATLSELSQVPHELHLPAFLGPEPGESNE